MEFSLLFPPLSNFSINCCLTKVIYIHSLVDWTMQNSLFIFQMRSDFDFVYFFFVFLFIFVQWKVHPTSLKLKMSWTESKYWWVLYPMNWHYKLSEMSVVIAVVVYVHTVSIEWWLIFFSLLVHFVCVCFLLCFGMINVERITMLLVLIWFV